MTDAKRAEILKANKDMADQALRVLAAAKRDWAEKPAKNEPAFLEQDLCFLGLTGMIDPVRPEVKPAIVECREAGIRPVMITGDHKDTAVAIAKELGIITNASQAITGAELDKVPDSEIGEAVKKYGVYARVQPEHKVRIVTAWKGNGAITAMTGDGVNDAPLHQGRRYRHRHGHHRHRRHQERGRHGAVRRQLCHHRGRCGGRPPHLRQHPQGHPVPAGFQHERGAGRVLRYPAGPSPCSTPSTCCSST